MLVQELILFSINLYIINAGTINLDWITTASWTESLNYFYPKKQLVSVKVTTQENDVVEW